MNHIKRSHYFVIGIVTVVSMLMNSCLEPGWDFERISDEVVLSPGIAAPLAFGSLSLDDMINSVDQSGYIEQTEEGLLYLSYADELITLSANQIINIPDQNFLEIFLDTEVTINPTDDTVRFHKEKNGVFVFQNNERLDSIHIKTMDLVINVSSSFRHTGLLTISSENILVNGEPFREVVQISDASGAFSEIRTIPLDGHTIYLDNSSPDTTILPLDFDLELVNSGNPILPSESCNITMTFVDPEFYAAFGYLGDYNLLLSNGDIILDIFDTDDLEGSLLFAEPVFTLDVSNSYGIPVDIDIYNVSAYSTINDESKDVIFQPGVNPFYIGAPDFSNIGESVNTLIEINNENCNIDEVMEIFPREFDYSISAITNPDGPGTQNFVTDSSVLKVDFEVTLPIYIKAEGFSLEQTQDFDFMEMFGESSDIIDYFRLTMDAANGLPMAVNMQLYFQDENYAILDSMFVDDEFLLAPLLNAEDKVTEPMEQSKSAEFTRERLKKLEPSKYMLIKARVNTPQAEEGRYVKFYSYYTIDFKIKMKADLTINSRDL